MSDIDQLLAQIPLAQIAQELGVDESQAEASSRTALEALLGGLHANSQDPAGAASLAQALGQHDNDLLGSGLSNVDTAQGQQIVENIFGGNTDNVIAQLGGVRGSGARASSPSCCRSSPRSCCPTSPSRSPAAVASAPSSARCSAA